MKARIYLTIGLTLLILTVQGAVAGSPGLISRPGRTSASGSGGSYTPSFSADGRWVAFVSQARNLTTNDVPGPYLNVFVRDLTNGENWLVSVDSTGLHAGDSDANAPTVSSNGQFIAFESSAGNLVANDSNRLNDVFVQNLSNGITTLVSVDAGGISSGNGASTSPLISAEGRWVIFESAATNLVANDTNGVIDVFARDLVTGTTLLVSADAAAAGAGAGRCGLGSVSADAGYVAFMKRASNWVENAVSEGEVYLRDVAAGTTEWASQGVATYFAAGNTNAYLCFNPVISADGSILTFQAGELAPSYSSPGIARYPVLLFRYRRPSGMLEVLATNELSSSCVALSVDGRFVAYVGTNGLYIHDAIAGTNHIIGTGDTEQFRDWRAPAITPDGSRVVFIASVSNQFGVYVHDWASGQTMAASINTNGAISSPVPVTSPVISDDGRLVAFESIASNLAANDFNQASDVFLCDLEAGTTQLLSAHHAVRTPKSGSGMATMTPISVSADGRFAAYASLDNELTSGDTNLWADIFLHDLLAGTNVNVSIRSRIAANRTNYASRPQISADGRYLAYWQHLIQTPPTNLCWVDLFGGVVRHLNFGIPTRSATPLLALSPEGRFLAFENYASNQVQILVRDMWASNPTNELIGTTGRPLSSPSIFLSFSADGRWIVFESNATNLVTNAAPSFPYSLFAHDLTTKQTRLVSYNSTGLRTSGKLTELASGFSADSRFVFYYGSGVQEGSNSVYRHDLLLNGSNVFCGFGQNASSSGDGRFVAYEAQGTNFTFNDIVVVEVATGQSRLVTVSTNGVDGANRRSFSPILSHDGHYIVFSSLANNLAPGDTNLTRDVFVRDLWAGTTMLVSINMNGTGTANSPSSAPLLAANGRTVFFQSYASDLVSGDFNNTRDIFTLQLGGPDTDGDGLDDDWEVAYFSTLARDGSGDFDSDGLTDAQEFCVGTNPADGSSVLRVLTVSSWNDGGRHLIWSASPGCRYRAEFKKSMDDAAWTQLAGEVVAAGTTATKLDPAPDSEGQRFYRVVRVP